MSEKITSLKLITCDYYLSSPLSEWDIMYSEYRSSIIKKIPIIRIFGISNTGEKVCLHVHGVLPYFYIPFDGSDSSAATLHQIASKLDNAINVSLSQANSTNQHIYKILLVSGIPFYGYHLNYHQFLKIFLYNPLFVRRLSNILEKESILGHIYQPHESHINYILQFMIDYNLHGMSSVYLSDFKIRDMYSSLSKMSTCAIEGDILAEHILNQREISKGVNPGIAYLWEDEKQRKRNVDASSQIGSFLSLGGEYNVTKSHMEFRDKLIERLSSDTSIQNQQIKPENITVYASETLIDKTPPEASILENHTPLSRDSSNVANENLDLSIPHNTTNYLIELLEDLDNPVPRPETDSMLSQVDILEDCEDNIDLSVPFETNNIPEDLLSQNLLSDNSSHDIEKEINKRIAQIDGNCDSSEEEVDDFENRTLSEESQRNSSIPQIVETSMIANYKSRKRKKAIRRTSTTPGSSNSQLTLDNIFNNNQDTSVNLLIDCHHQLMKPKMKPPTIQYVTESLSYQFPSKSKIQKPFYSNPTDIPNDNEGKFASRNHQYTNTECYSEFTTIYSGIEKYRMLNFYSNNSENIQSIRLSYSTNNFHLMQPILKPPTFKNVQIWVNEKKTNTVDKYVEKEQKYAQIQYQQDLSSSLDNNHHCSLNLTLPPLKNLNQSGQVSAVTLNNTFGFKMNTPNFQNAKCLTHKELLTVLVIELHICTRGDLKPDPEYDAIDAIFYSLLHSTLSALNNQNAIETGIIVATSYSRIFHLDCNVTICETERDLLTECIQLIKKWNPDILIGYEIEMLSWGYLIQRGQFIHVPIAQGLSRICIEKQSQRNYENLGTIHESLLITGRIMLDLWRLLRHEISLQSYTFENIVYHVLHQRTPYYSFKQLTQWWQTNEIVGVNIVLKYYTFRVTTIFQLLERLDFIGRTSELARLFGIQFYEVLSRGSQFRVESMMLRLAKPMNFIPVSPSVAQRARMRAPEFLPLILEPQSKLFLDPVIVLDFQSLYPSVMIAHNYCFSTCLGRIDCLGSDEIFEFGATQLRVTKALVQDLLDKDALNFSPCGVAFVKSHIRDGILPKMLREILGTRLMVKASMKDNISDENLQKILHNRQLGLKLIANVTYGYTAANFSGRMPAVDLADSVVSKGRETLQEAIYLVENTKSWGAQVVYGDTDSLFVLVPGRTRTEAFQIGNEIANRVTVNNPRPIKLKLEKVYQPCILQTKKRYVGYSYEEPDQVEPSFDAKGIETVRRDGCPAVSKMLEKCLRLLFDTNDISVVKAYVTRQFHRLLTNRASIQDLIFAKEYRGISGYRPGACVPALELAKRWMVVDRRSEPRKGERVPYLIATGPPRVPLIRLVYGSKDFLTNDNLRPNILYYITKVIIPPLNRCFNLLNVDVNSWFIEMPRKLIASAGSPASPNSKATIEQYFSTTKCLVCTSQTDMQSICAECLQNPQSTIIVCTEKCSVLEKKFHNLQLICSSCSGFQADTSCSSLDCPVLYRFIHLKREVYQSHVIRQILNNFT